MNDDGRVPHDLLNEPPAWLAAHDSRGRVSALELEHLLFENAEQRERILGLEADVAVYRELTSAALDALRDLTCRHRALQDSSTALREEYRAVRQEWWLTVGAADADSEAA